MAWNNLLDQLTYYLSNLYLMDMANVQKARLFQTAGFVALDIRWNESPRNIWYQLLKHAADRNKVDKLLEVLLKNDEGNADDEFLKGAMKNIRENKDINTKELPNSDWKGGEITRETKEKMMGKSSTLLPIGFLETGTEKAKAVVRIEDGAMLGTGFVIKHGWLVTNNHVLPDRETAMNAKLEFGFQFPKGLKKNQREVSEIKAERVATLDPGTPENNFFYTNEEEDWTIVRIREKDIDNFGYLELSSRGTKADDFVNIIQHPLGGPKQIAIYHNLVMYADEKIVQYTTDTDKGSSGSPVLNSDWDVVAIHHSGGSIIDPATKQVVWRNQGTNIKKLIAFIETNKLNNS